MNFMVFNHRLLGKEEEKIKISLQENLFFCSFNKAKQL